MRHVMPWLPFKVGPTITYILVAIVVVVVVVVVSM
jgi:hypothetical protein